MGARDDFAEGWRVTMEHADSGEVVRAWRCAECWRRYKLTKAAAELVAAYGRPILGGASAFGAEK